MSAAPPGAPQKGVPLAERLLEAGELLSEAGRRGLEEAIDASPTGGRWSFDRAQLVRKDTNTALGRRQAIN